MSNFDHVVLFLFLFLFFIIWASKNALVRKNSNYWSSALLPIFFYSIITGSRYGWGVDFNGYKDQFEHASKFNDDQPLFKWLNLFINDLGLDFVGAFTIYSLIFIVSCFVLIRSYGKYSVYMYYFVLPATLLFTTAIIRQGVALSFVFLSLYFLNRKKWLGVGICVLIGSAIHSSILVTAAIIILIYFLFKKPLNWKLTIPAYLFFALFFNSESMGFLVEFLTKYISFDNRFQSYVDNSELWFGKEGVNDIYMQSPFALFMSSLFYISMIYIGYIALRYKPNTQIIYIYNVVVVGIIVFKIVFLYEILRRFAEPMLMLYFIVLGYSFFVIDEMRKDNRIDVLSYKKNKPNNATSNYRIFIWIIVIYHVMYWSRFVFLNPEAMFFWNL